MFAYCCEQSVEDDSRQILDLVECVHLCSAKLFRIAASLDMDGLMAMYLVLCQCLNKDCFTKDMYLRGTEKVRLIPERC